MAGKIFDYRDWDIVALIDKGLSGDFIYGSCVELDRFREDNREQLLRLVVLICH
jgi:hypothetical protein